MITRRRFLTIAAAAAATPASAAPVRWHGTALGAKVSMTLHAPYAQAAPAIRMVRGLLRHAEALFSLYDDNSQLSRLNRDGYLRDPAPELRDLLNRADQVHAATGGVFDPTIQPLWQAVSRGGDPAVARALVDWSRVRVLPEAITLGPGQAVTLNGIAQGFATDMVARALRTAGLSRVLVNIGEFAGVGGPWRIGISDPDHGLVATSTLTDRAIATSSPGTLTLNGDRPHILGPAEQPTLWSTVSVQAASATVADAASTAFCLMDVGSIRTTLTALPGAPSAVLVAQNGRVTRIG